jgi:molybdopterin converting factor small subunit
LLIKVRVEKEKKKKRKEERIMRIKVAQLGGEIRNLDLAQGATVGTLLDGAIVQSGFELRVNNVPGSSDIELQEGDIVTLVPQIRGGIA